MSGPYSRGAPQLPIPPRVKRIDSFFDLVAKQLEFSSINPRNEQRKRQLFFANKRDPQFSYAPMGEHLQQLRDVLVEIRLDKKDPLERLLERKRRELVLKIDLLQAVGTDRFAKVSRRLYPLPSQRTVAQAHSLLALPPSPSSVMIHRKEGIRMIRRMLSQLGLRYRIRSTDMVASARVDAAGRLLELRKRERFSEDYFKRLVVHEIGTHVLRTENGLLQPLRIFKNGFPGYLSTEEGLAAYNEFRAGVMSNSIIRNYAGRVVAVDAASKEGFLGTYKEVRRFFSASAAWKLALRAKRGLGDTGDAGAYTKDASYLQGFFDVIRFSQKRSVDELYVGKVGIGDFSLLRRAGLPLVAPKYTLARLLEQGLITPSERRVEEHKVLELL